METNSAAPPPLSPACKTGCGTPKKVVLVPHGYTGTPPLTPTSGSVVSYRL